MITIDGSQGEGGGQILRSALALALVTGRAFRITRIRAGRKQPGLMRQHLTAVKAAAEVGQAKLRGAELGSTELIFEPGEVRPGDYHFAVGTAGSATLVLQAVLPPLLESHATSHVTIEGGTHNMHAPPFDFLAKTFAPIVNRLGPSLEVTLTRPGFYPAGGGEVVATVTPAVERKRLELTERGKCRSQCARALVARLPASIAERELRVIGRRLGWTADQLHAEEIRDSRGPGNVVMIELEYEHVTEACTAFGTRGVPAEAVADSAVDQAQRYLSRNAPVGEHLADQLLLPLAVSNGGTFRTTDLSEHTKTNIEVIKRFLDVAVETEQEQPGTWRVTVSP